MADSVLVKQVKNIRWLTINRPEVRNAVDTETMVRLREEIEKAEKDGTRVVVLTGAGEAFSSGADIKAALAENISPDEAYQIMLETYTPTLLRIWNSPLSIVAAINGVAAGIGLNLALACDIRLASERATFSEIFVRVGLIPDGGGIFTLPRLVGMGQALELAFTGDTIDAGRALKIGLVNRVFPVEKFETEVFDFASHLAQQSPLALARMKRAFHQAQQLSFEEALKAEARFQKEIFQSEDGFEGFRAFLEKRKPRWKGR